MSSSRWALIAVLAFGCSKETFQVKLQASCLQPDGGTRTACEKYKELSCVNFLRFHVLVDGQELTRCAAASELLGRQPDNFCDFQQAMARGIELFDLKPEQTIKMSVEGLRVYPITTCQGLDECMRPPLFKGESPTRKVADLAGADLAIQVTQCNSCGKAEVFLPNPDHRPCERVCLEEVVCAPLNGCLCAEGKSDGGTP